MSELVGLNTETPDMFGKISQLLQIQQQRQGVRTATAQAEGAEQSQRQRAAIAAYDWNKHIGEDGTLDLNTVINDPELQAAAGDQWQEVVGRAIQGKTQQLESKRTLVSLRNDQRAAFAEMLGGLRSDQDVAEDTPKGRQKVTDAMVQFGEMYGEDTLPVLSAYAAPTQKAPKGRLSDALRAIQMQAQSVSQQLAAQAPTYVDTGANLLQSNPNAAAGRPVIPKSIAPGASVFTDARTGNPYRVDAQTGATADLGGGGIAPTAPPSAPARPSSMPAPFYPGQAHDIGNQQQEVDATRKQADTAPANRNIFRHILELADDTSTGPLVKFLQDTKVGGQVFGDNYQELGKYLEKNAIANMTAMGGPPSDDRLHAAVLANGSTAFNPKALKAVTEFNYATNTGLERYRQGMDAAVGTSGAIDYGKLPAFKAAWAKNFDIDAFRLENAVADGDVKQQKAILADLSPARRKEVAAKMANLDTLSETGKLP